MRPLAIALSIAISGIMMSTSFTPVSANKMNGKCCQSSDGGRSDRYKRIMSRRAIPRTCSAYAASCIRDSADKADAVRACRAAKAQCLRTGIHVGPYSGFRYAGMQRK